MLSNVSLDSFPAIKYDQEELLPTMEGRYFKDLFYYAFHELLKNLCYYSDRDYAKLYVQIGTYKECIPAMRILSRNKEPIKEIVSILHGGKIRFNSEGFGIICLKEFALINRGVWLIIDTNGGRICFSKDDGIIQDRSIYPGTEVQMIIKIPSLSTDNQSIQGAIVFKKYPLQSL